MGEQVNKEEAKVEAAAEKKEEEAAAAAAEKTEEEESEEKKEAAAGGGGEEAAKPPSPPPAVILAVDLHCTGCAKRIKRSILRCEGVEGVEVDLGGNQVTVKGVVDPRALCARVQKKTMRKATVVSPLPPPPPPVKPPQLAHPQVRTVELLVNMHCDACAEQLHKKMLKMTGVQAAETNLDAGKLTVTGTMTDDKIVEYIHRRAGKLATVVPPPPPPEPPKEEAAGEKKQDDEADKKEEKPAEDDGNKKSEEQAVEAAAKDDSKAAADDKHKEEEEEEEPAKREEEGVVVDRFPPEEMMKRMVYWPYGDGGGYKQYPAEEVMMARRMAMNTMPHPTYAMMQWMPPPLYYSNYMADRPAPAPQLFSDENPNACVIS